MPDVKNHINYISWDSEFFGFKIGEIKEYPKEIMIRELIEYCKENGYKLLYVKTESIEQSKHESLIENNGILADQKIIYRMPLTMQYQEVSNHVLISDCREISPELLEIVLQTGKFSRFNTDVNFGREKYEKLYTLWINKSIKKEIADEVVYYIENGEIQGYFTLSYSQDIGLIGLFGVNPKHQRKGIGKELLKKAVNLSLNRKCKILQVSTQFLNEQACLFYENFGFSTHMKELIYHFWL